MKENENALHWCGLARFSKKTGRIDTTMVGLGKGVLKLWALQNTPSNKATVVVDLEDRRTLVEYKGTADGFPEVCRDEDLMEFNIPLELYEAMDAEAANR